MGVPERALLLAPHRIGVISRIRDINWTRVVGIHGREFAVSDLADIGTRPGGSHRTAETSLNEIFGGEPGIWRKHGRRGVEDDLRVGESAD
jgi:hypothetical protein